MTIQWVSVDLRTGGELTEMPDLLSDGYAHTIGKYDTATAKLKVDARLRPPANWVRGTQPLKSMLAALDADSGAPMWGGISVQRLRPSKGPVQLSLMTPEGYTQRRFIRDALQYPATDRCTIAADLLTRYVVDGASGRNGLPLRIVVTPGGVLTDADYKPNDDKSVYSALQDLGCEWTFGLERLHSPERITLVAYIAERIGTAVAPGREPLHTFDYPGNLLSASVVDDYSTGKGANDVIATSTGQGSVRPTSDPQVAAFPDMPTVEHRFPAGQGVTSLARLNAYAAGVLANMKDGQTGYAFTASLQNAPLPGRDWQIGDDIGFDLTGPQWPEHPKGIARAMGVILNKTSFSPVLVEGADGA